jgi:hypothetical protein
MEQYTTDELPDEAVIFDSLVEAKMAEGVLYTQVDADDDVVYVKGNHLVNRTGVYAVIPFPRQ